MTGKLSKNFHGVGIGPLSNILAVNSIRDKDNDTSPQGDFRDDREKGIPYLPISFSHSSKVTV